MLREAVEDILAAARMRQLWLHSALADITIQYRRSIIGPFWLTLQMALLVAALAVLYSALFRQDIRTFLPYVAAGILVWNSISMVTLEGCRTFIGNAPLMLNTNLPLPVFAFRDVARNVIVFFHNLAAIILIYLYFPEYLTFDLLLLVPGIALLIVNALWVCLLLGMISARYRDMPQMVAALMQVAIFVTPVFWPASLIPRGMVVVHGNVFYHLIEIVRAPILGTVPSLENYAVVLGMTVVGWILALGAYARYRSRIVFSL
jgi:ABC-2 type transport system permease protein/lipopolysaccharide transport system permease protein